MGPRPLPARRTFRVTTTAVVDQWPRPNDLGTRMGLDAADLPELAQLFAPMATPAVFGPALPPGAPPLDGLQGDVDKTRAWLAALDDASAGDVAGQVRFRAEGRGRPRATPEPTCSGINRRTMALASPGSTSRQPPPVLAAPQGAAGAREQAHPDHQGRSPGRQDVHRGVHPPRVAQSDAFEGGADPRRASGRRWRRFRRKRRQQRVRQARPEPGRDADSRGSEVQRRGGEEGVVGQGDGALVRRKAPRRFESPGVARVRRSRQQWT